jgi:phenylpropionate dioxygenase-like ring-hydroxylating dioxygenase large terminal subunit
MKSNIPALHYFDTDIFARERNAVFSKLWNFVGFRSQLLNPNDFVTRRIADTPVVVQNMKGSIKAFLNVCSHRFSVIQQAPSGNRALVCPYHGWAYDANGVPSGIPKKPLFKDFSSDELVEMKLRPFRVDFCGNLCFVSLSASGPDLKTYLGDFHPELEQLSFSLGALIDVNQMVIGANWKVIVENTLESYHVTSIHETTFKKLGAQGIEFAFAGYHSNWNAPLHVNRADPANRKIEELFADRSYKIDGYRHFLVFPNLLISSTHGSSYNFSLIEPVTPGSSNFSSYVFTATHGDDAKKALMKAYEQSLVAFNRQVFDEDKAICEAVQKGVGHTTQHGVLSLEEERVHAFQKNYTSLMNESQN